MATKSPYSSPGLVAAWFKQIEKHTPDKITLNTLQYNGITEANARILLSTLRNMNIIDESGRPVDKNELNRLAIPSERQAVLRRIVERTYAELLANIPVETATVERIENYFRLSHEPASMASKMARFFVWIAAEAGYDVAEKIEPSKLVTRSIKPTKTSNNAPSKNVPDESEVSTETAIQEAVEYARKVLPPEKMRLMNLLLDKMEKNPEYPPEYVINTLRELLDEYNK